MRPKRLLLATAGGDGEDVPWHITLYSQKHAEEILGVRRRRLRRASQQERQQRNRHGFHAAQPRIVGPIPPPVVADVG